MVRAYETLEMECYVESRPASGMFATGLVLGARARGTPNGAGDRHGELNDA
jgi:hypothetical protein